MNQIYFGQWEIETVQRYASGKSSFQALEDDFNIELPPEANILFANYEEEGYEGYAFVIFEKGGKLYEVNGSHCSCYGLEDQWEPEEIVMEELTERIVNESNFTFSKMSGEARFALIKLILSRKGK